MNVNVTSAECLRTMTHFGYSRVHNLCNGTFQDLPWGGMDWLGASAICLIFLFGTAFLLRVGFEMFDRY